MDDKQPCPVCGNLEVVKRPYRWDEHLYDCPNCGQYILTGSALTELQKGGLTKQQVPVLSHYIWRMQKKDNATPPDMSNLIEDAKKGNLPDPAEQLDLLILYLGENQEDSGSHKKIRHHDLCAKIGAANDLSALFIVRSAVDLKLVDNRLDTDTRFGIRLTMLGWQRYQELQRGTVISKTAFMAMKFGDDDLDRMVNEAFRPAVTQAGFKLKRVDDEPRAGLIDDRIRVEIRLCRFLIADLTCDNNGAYWEAGYAEGLGKPVIYTCNKFYFDHEKKGTHFDTNHHQTVLWVPDKPEEAAEQLKAIIRNTLPFEAKMEDDE